MLDASARARRARASGRRRRRVARARRASGRRARASPRRSRPSTSQLVGRRRRGARRRGAHAPAACSSATQRGDRVRRLRRGSNHVLPTGGAARFASGARRRATSGAAWPRCALGRRRGRALAPRRRRRSRGPRASPCTPSRWRPDARIRRHEPHRARSHAQTGETDVSLALDLDGGGAGTRSTGVGFFDHMLDLLARHGRLDLDVAGDGRPRDRRRTTRSRTSASCSARRSTRRSATAPGSAATATRVVPMDEARAACAIDISGPAATASSRARRCRRATIAGFEHRAGRGVLPRRRQRRAS